jgi:hypothetical protein
MPNNKVYAMPSRCFSSGHSFVMADQEETKWKRPGLFNYFLKEIPTLIYLVDN